jgi:hypothetical protein
MKTLNLIAWISAVIGVLLLLLAPISLIVHNTLIGSHIINFFHAANSFFLLTIILFLGMNRIEIKK